MTPTKNDLSSNIRQQMVQLLNQRLADAIDLEMQMKQAHWNVAGPTFIALHELFDKVHSEAEEWVDLIAERALQLGGSAEGTVQSAASKTTLRPYPLGVADGAAHVAAVSEALGSFGKVCRAAIDSAAEAGDAVTSDIFTEIARASDKQLWFVEAHAKTS